MTTETNLNATDTTSLSGGGKRIEGLLLDYGGTIDTNGHHWFDVMCEMYFDVGIRPNKDMLRKAYVFAEQMMARYNERIRPTNSFKNVLQQKINYQITYLVKRNAIEQVTPYKIDSLVDVCFRFARRTVTEQKPVLAALAEKCPLVLVSNFYGNLRSVLKDFGIDSYFKDVVESAVVGVRKPDAQIFRIGLQALGMDASQVAVVGDSYKNDIAPAKKIGCTSIWLKVAGWEDYNPESTLTADYVIDDLKKVVEII